MSDLRFTRRDGDEPPKPKPEPTGKAEISAPHPSAEDLKIPKPEPKPMGAVSRSTIQTCFIGFAAIQVVAVWFSMGGLGMSWDEAYYFEPNANAVIWAADWMRGGIVAEEGNDRYWEDTWELLAVPRFVHGFSGWLFEDSWLANRNVFSPLVAQRLLNAVFHGVNCWLIGMLLLPLTGLGAALAAMAAYGTMPRIFGHAHFAATETLMITMTLLVALLFIGGLKRGWVSIFLGIAFGLALNTKFNLIFLPVPLWIWAWIYHRNRAMNNVMAMTFISPVVWFLTWPWIWKDTVPRLVDYFTHFLIHQQTTVWFHGEKWGWATHLAPMTYPVEMIAVTTPIITLLFGIIGLSRCLRTGGADRRGHLFILIGLVPLLIASAPGSPKYDGVRLFLPVLACLALFVGVAVADLYRFIQVLYPRQARGRRFIRAYHIVMILLLALPGAWSIVRVHPCELSYFNTFVGGIDNAAARGFEATYWCETINEDVVGGINEMLPPNATLAPLAMHERILDFYQRWDVLRSDIRIQAFGDGPTDYALLQRREGFFGLVENDLWHLWESSNARWFGWPRGADEPKVPLVVVAQTGEAFQNQVMRHAQTMRNGGQ